MSCLVLIVTFSSSSGRDTSSGRTHFVVFDAASHPASRGYGAGCPRAALMRDSFCLHNICGVVEPGFVIANNNT